MFMNFSEVYTLWQEGGAASSRRRKKRKKKKVPKTRRRPLPQLVVCHVGMRIRRQGHGFALALRGSGAHCVAVHVQGWFYWFTMHLALCSLLASAQPRSIMFPSGVAQPRMLVILASMDQEVQLQQHVQGWLCWFAMHLALFSFFWFSGPRCSASWPV